MIEIPGCAHIIHVSVQHSCTEHPTHCQDTGLDTEDRILSKANTGPASMWLTIRDVEGWLACIIFSFYL